MIDLNAIMKRSPLHHLPLSIALVATAEPTEAEIARWTKCLHDPNDELLLLLAAPPTGQRSELQARYRLRFARAAGAFRVRYLFDSDPESGRALERLIAAARSPRVLIAPLDANLQENSFAELLATLQCNDYVASYRPSRKAGREPLPVRLLWRWLVGNGPCDPLCPIVALRKRAVEGIPLQTRGPLRMAELAAKLIALGGLLAEVPLPERTEIDSPGLQTATGLFAHLRRQGSTVASMFVRPQLWRFDREKCRTRPPLDRIEPQLSLASMSPGTPSRHGSTQRPLRRVRTLRNR